MAFNNPVDIAVAGKAQTTFGTEESSGSGATSYLYVEGSGGFQTSAAAQIDVGQNLGDGMTERARLGSFNVPGSFNIRDSVNNHDIWWPTFFRNDYVAQETTAPSDLSSATLSVSGSVITFSDGDLTSRIKVGDVVKFASGLAAADNNKPLPVIALTATTLTTSKTLTTVTGPVSSYSMVRPKYLVPGKVDHFYTFDTYRPASDLSHTVYDAFGNGFSVSLTENQAVNVTQNWLAAGFNFKETASSPHFTTPTTPTDDALAFLDACFSIDGSEVLTVTGFTINGAQNTQSLAVANACGPNPGKSPTITQGALDVSGSFSMALEDFTLLKKAAAETQIDFFATLKDPNNAARYKAYSLTNVISLTEDLTPLGQIGTEIVTFNFGAGREKRGGAYSTASLKMTVKTA